MLRLLESKISRDISALKCFVYGEDGAQTSCAFGDPRIHGLLSLTKLGGQEKSALKIVQKSLRCLSHSD